MSIRVLHVRAVSWLIAALTFIVIAPCVHACNVPVFRYALEHWRPDAYRGVLFHRGPLGDADRQSLADLQARAEKGTINLTMRTVDLDAAPQAADVALAGDVASGELPRLVVQYPAHFRVERPVWSGPMTAETMAALIDSPARREVLKRLTAGQSAVWLMIDSGQDAADASAAKTLERELQHLQGTLKLPVLTDSPEDAIQDGPALRVEFSLLRIRRDDPAEQPLVALLLGSEDDLKDLQEPMVFPVFGRSRCLLPLVGVGIATDTIRSSAAFLSGACSCQVKELNPGFDLLLTADWKELLFWAKSPASAEERLKNEPAEAELVAIPRGSHDANSETAVAAEELPLSAPATKSSGRARPPGPQGVWTWSSIVFVLAVGLLLLSLIRPRSSS